MSALRRVLRAPGLWLALWLLGTALAMASVGSLRRIPSSLAGPRLSSDESGWLHALFELIADQPAILGSAFHAVWFALTVRVLVDLATAGPIVERLSAPTAGSELLAAAGRWLLPSACQLLWIWLVRAPIIVIIVLAARMPNVAAIPSCVVVGLALAITWPAGQLARARIVLRHASPYHVRTTWHALVDTVRCPAYVGGFLVVLVARSLLAGVGFVYASEFVLAESTLWLARTASLVATGLTLWMAALAVEMVETKPQR